MEKDEVSKATEAETNAGFLHRLNTAKLSWFHIKAVIVAGMGFFSDAYDLFTIGLLTKLLGRIYYQEYHPGAKPGQLPIGENAAVSALALVGTLLGQLFFGWAGDKFGRKPVYGLSLLIMIVSAVMSGMTFGPTTDRKAVIGTLCFFRFFLGFGVGGDYPLSSVIMSEYSSKFNRGAFVGAVFAMQGMGILCAAAVGVIVSAIFNSAYSNVPFGGKTVESIHASCPPAADFAWRIVLAFGAIPAILTMYARLTLPETPRFTMMVKQDVVQAAKDTAEVMGTDVDQAPSEPRKAPLTTRQFLRIWWKPLIGCAMSWFLLDIAFYSQNLYQKDVFTSVGWIPPAKQMGCLDEMYRIARAQAIISLASTVPGYWFTVFTVDKIGRIPIQLGGFFMMTLFMAVLSGDYDNLRLHNTPAFVTLYALTFFFSNWGPNATTFIIPAELFPTSWKTTAHGFCAAAGKAGAIVGAFGFLYASQPKSAEEAAPYPPGMGLQGTLGLLAAINFCGMFFTLMIPETKGRTLEELNGEDGSTPSFFNVDVAAAISKEQEEAAKANHAAAVAART